MLNEPSHPGAPDLKLFSGKITLRREGSVGADWVVEELRLLLNLVRDDRGAVVAVERWRRTVLKTIVGGRIYGT